MAAQGEPSIADAFATCASAFSEVRECLSVLNGLVKLQSELLTTIAETMRVQSELLAKVDFPMKEDWQSGDE